MAHVEPARPHRTQNWHLTKPSARGRHGIVVSQNREAAEAGVAILESGGNAADAAVAACFALAALEPWNSGLGGIGFAVVLKAGETRAQVVDFGPVAPHRADPADYPLTGAMKKDLFTWPEVEGDRNIHGPLSFCIPSSVAGYARLKEEFGSSLPLAELLAPAIALAKRGLPQDWYTTLKVASSASVLRLYQESARIYLPGGLPPVPPYQGTPGFFPLGELHTTLERLAKAGLSDFYTGETGRLLVQDIAEAGGVVDMRDLEACAATVREAPVIEWRGTHLLHTAGGLTAAPTLAEVVEGMAGTKASKDGPDAAWFAKLSTVMRQAYRSRLEGLGAAQAAAQEPGDTCTTHLTVVDGEGNLVAVTTTLLSSMGSRVVLPRTGVLMNNGMMWFDPRPGSANAIAPGARPLCNMCPVVVTPKDGSWPRMAVGASGGRRILASVYQTLAWSLDFGMDVDDVAHQPRIDVSGPDSASADLRLPADVLAALEAAGPLAIVEHSVLPINFACPNFIRVDRDGAEGCSDVVSPWSAAVAATA
ncbi:gamma-glutamyltransferase [Bosea lathyri]|uniref:Gamma-glutamyltransferase 1 Threonine peptidase. MEROPS family T03 n=1 Tax=Bosea lathyri TaxID=1036778 RepID=A0A1H6CS57_9HYPH|nr:gamma-glutamyltransferase [Bosea lathyri]SEG75794.1 gamma-glutamyltransferase 1 Threonine peptidase. MEROPS family T03 [Bosea lathyri]